MTDDPEATLSRTNPQVGIEPLPRRGRFQFSLASLLWPTTFAVCLAALWAMYRDLQLTKAELRAARDEVQKYRGEMGYLDISDSKKLYTHRIRTAEAYKWAWRVHVPNKRKYELCMVTKRIPLEGLPRSGNRLTLNGFYPASGELLVDASAGLAQDGKRRLAVKVTKRLSGGSASASTDCEMNPSTGRGMDSTGGVGEDSQECLDPGSPLILVRSREATSGHGFMQQGPQPCDGIMIWIEEAK